MAATWLAMGLSRTGYLMWSPALRHDVNKSEYAEVREKLQGALRTVSPHVKRIILPGQPTVFGMPHRIAPGPPVRGHAPSPPSVFTPGHRRQGNCHSKLLRITTRLPMSTRADCFCSSGKYSVPRERYGLCRDSYQPCFTAAHDLRKRTWAGCLTETGSANCRQKWRQSCRWRTSLHIAGCRDLRGLYRQARMLCHGRPRCG